MISIARNFSRIPAGRYLTDGPYSGEKFREEMLIPAFKDPSINLLEINFDGTRGYGSSFLEEAFGGLARELKIDAKTIFKKLKLVSNEDDTIISEVTEYIKRAAAKD